MNRLFLQYIQEKQKNNFEMISFKNSMRKNCWQNPLSIVESEVVPLNNPPPPSMLSPNSPTGPMLPGQTYPGQHPIGRDGLPYIPKPGPYTGETPIMWPDGIIPDGGGPGVFGPNPFIPDYNGPSVFDPVDHDIDEDGIPDSTDPDIIPFEDQDHDGDGIPNFMDPDSIYYNPDYNLEEL
jgi:hypothetical protein